MLIILTFSNKEHIKYRYECMTQRILNLCKITKLINNKACKGLICSRNSELSKS